MNDASTFISGGWIFTLGYDLDTGEPTFVKMRTDASEKTVLETGGTPHYITVNGEYIYAVLSNEDDQSIYRFRLGGDDKKKIVKGATYFRIYDDMLYYCKIRKDDSDRTVSFCKSDLDGKNEEVILDKEVYFPYIIDNELYYQDDSDNESIHLYNLDTKEDIKINDKKTYGFVLDGKYMYCIENDGSTKDSDDSGTLVKLDLESLSSKELYEGVATRGFSVKDDNIFFINTNDEGRVYSIDKEGGNISLVSQDDYCDEPLVYEDKLVYWDSSSDFQYLENIFICNLDGSDKIDIFND